MDHLDKMRESLPDVAKDHRLNLQAVLSGENLAKGQALGCAIAAAAFLREPQLLAALRADARAAGVSEGTVADAEAAAALMGMTTVFYRFRHLVEKESYSEIPARLRMSRMAQVASTKVDFELFSLACAALAGCGTCIKAHEEAILRGGLTEAHVHDAVRIAATLNGAAVGLGLR